MTPAKALELVTRYSELTWQIKSCKNRIAIALDQCTGLDGKRLLRRNAPWDRPLDDMDDSKNEKQTHLSAWLTPEIVEHDYGGGSPEWEVIGFEHNHECPHCFEAYLAIQERKRAKRQLASVKAAMTKVTPKPEILKWTPEFQHEV